MAHETGESQNVEVVNLRVDREALQDMNHLKDLLRSPNLTTALYNAVVILNDLYEFKRQGYDLRLVKNDDTRRFHLPD